MDKQSKFKLLEEIALTRDEAEEYFEQQETEEENPNRIFLPMSIVYETKRKEKYFFKSSNLYAYVMFDVYSHPINNICINPKNEKY